VDDSVLADRRGRARRDRRQEQIYLIEQSVKARAQELAPGDPLEVVRERHR
jgi:hypothetical protein